MLTTCGKNYERRAEHVQQSHLFNIKTTTPNDAGEEGGALGYSGWRQASQIRPPRRGARQFKSSLPAKSRGKILLWNEKYAHVP